MKPAETTAELNHPGTLAVQDEAQHASRQGKKGTYDRFEATFGRRADYKTLFESNHVAIASTSSGFKFTAVNEAFENLIGYSAEELYNGMNLSDISPSEAHFTESKNLIRKLLAGEIDKFEIEKVYRHKDGHKIEAITSVMGIFLEDGTLVGTTAFIFDVTQQRKMERELRQALARVEAAQEELVRSEKLASLGALVAGIAHEINTPLGNSLTLASTLEAKTAETLQRVSTGNERLEELMPYLKRAEKGLELLNSNLKDACKLIANFKRLAVDRTGDIHRQFNLAELIENLLATTSHLYGSKIQFQVEVDPQIVCNSYPGEMTRIFANLIQNAVLHAFPDGGSGLITIQGQYLEEKNDWVQVSFSDNGVGMIQEHAAKAFDPFFTTTMGKGGSGLGLYIVYSLVNKVLGGTITLSTESQEGATFVLKFPASLPFHE